MVTTEGSCSRLLQELLCVENIWSSNGVAPVKMGANGEVILTGSTPTSRPEKQSLRMVLRGATAVDHENVDAAFGRFDLTSATSYAEFLTAHARVLGALESTIAGLWPDWHARFPLLQSDLADLGITVAAEEASLTQSEAARWGMLYVIEGSRLGGGILSGRVGAGLPTRYLSATHEGGSWRHFGDALEQAGALQGDDWRDAVVAGAKLAFARFASSAMESRS